MGFKVNRTKAIIWTNTTIKSICYGCFHWFVYDSIFLSYRKLLVACDNRQISCYDLHSLPTAIFTRDSILKYSIRCIHFLSDNNGYIVGSIEGRVGVEYITETETCKPFSFRCHRKSDTYNEYVYPVNAIAVHPQYGTFATGGADGTVCIWDSVAKKRLAIFSKYEY